MKFNLLILIFLSLIINNAHSNPIGFSPVTESTVINTGSTLFSVQPVTIKNASGPRYSIRATRSGKEIEVHSDPVTGYGQDQEIMTDFIVWNISEGYLVGVKTGYYWGGSSHSMSGYLKLFHITRSNELKSIYLGTVYHGQEGGGWSEYADISYSNPMLYLKFGTPMNFETNQELLVACQPNISTNMHIYKIDIANKKVLCEKSTFEQYEYSKKYKPSFSCLAKLSNIESAICNDPAISSLDSLLSTIYTKAKASGVTSSKEQKEWLIIRNKCHNSKPPLIPTCITIKYRNRINDLLQKI